MISKTTRILAMALLLLSCSHGLPTYFANKNSDLGYKEAKERSFYMKYLEKYGYLEPLGTKGSMRVNQTEITDALKNFQKMAGIPITGLFDAATNDTMHVPRCGVKDIEKHESQTRVKRIAGYGWLTSVLSYRLKNSTHRISKDKVESEIKRAFDMWSGQTALNFTMKDNGTVDILLYFAKKDHGDGDPFDGKGRVLAHAFYPDNGDIHFDDEEDWTVRSNSGQDLFGTILHEIGHSLGLDHSYEGQAIMYAYAKSYDPHLKLHYDDIRRIQAIYGPNPYIYCGNPTVDAITRVQNGTIFAFKGKHYYRLIEVNGQGFKPESPRSLKEWKNINGPIDSALTLKNGSTYLFQGYFYWEFNNQKYIRGPTRIDVGFPRNWGVSSIPGSIDATFVWSGNDMVYFIKDNRYWRFNGRNMDYGNGPMAAWKGLPSKIDAALSFNFTSSAELKTYFLSGNNYYIFDDSNDSVNTTGENKEFWFGCPDMDETPNYMSAGDGSPQALNADIFEIPIFGGAEITTSNMHVLFVMLWCGMAIIHLF